MKNFFKIVLGSMVGFGLLLFIGFLLLIASISNAGKADKVKLEPNSILKIELASEIPDKTVDNPFGDINPMGFNVSSATGLFEMIDIIEHAKNDDKIKGLYITTDFVSESFASLDQLRRVLADFKSSGKFILAYNKFSTQKSYLISSVADELYLHPMGMFEFDGLSIETMYYKKLFDKLDITPIPLYAGDFKSASEPYRVTEMSDSNRVQLHALLEDLYDNYLTTISEARGKTKEELKALADELAITDPSKAVEFGLVDKLGYEDEVFDALRTKMGYEKDKELSFIALDDYSTTYKSTNHSKEKIAVVYLEGNIVFGKGKSGQIGDEYIEIVRKLRKDDKVKAIVLRVNSPGGVAFTSDQIWRELALAKKEKPLVVSMGNYAASGGYYLSCMADKIYAEKNTITGSIGVVGVLLNVENFLENKIGITFDREKTNQYADFGNLKREWSDREKEVAQLQIKNIYHDFKERVAEGRNMTMERVEEIAQGRVWTGQDALQIGLVDEIGDLKQAISTAAELANLEEYKLKEFPEEKDFYEQLKEMMSVKTDKAIKKELGEFYDTYQKFQEIQEWSGIQTRMPFEMSIE